MLGRLKRTYSTLVMHVAPIKIFSPILKEQQELITLRFESSKIVSQADTSICVKVKVINDSALVLECSQKSNAFLSYKIAMNGHELEGQRTEIKLDIPAHSSEVLNLDVSLIGIEGELYIKPCIVQEKIAWLDHIDSSEIPLISRPVIVQEGARYARNRPIHSERIPVIFNFELTNRCPFGCIMCARTNNMTRPEGLMEFTLFKTIIDQLDEIESDKTQELWLHGFGESLVHPEFDLFMQYAIKKGFNAGLSVNPFLLTEKTARKLLKCQPKHLYLAIDGHDNESFQKIRGLKGAYDKSVERLERFLVLKSELSPDTKVDIGMIDFELNQESIKTMEEKWKNIDPKVNFLAKPFTTWDGSASDVLALKNNEKVPKLHSQKTNVTCDFPWTKMTVNWDGKVTPCCYDYNKKYVLGDLNYQSLIDIWNGESMKSLRTEFKSEEVKNSLCVNCENLSCG